MELFLTGVLSAVAGGFLGWGMAVRRQSREISSLRAQLEQARAEARTDPLTGLWNRAAFHENLQIQAALARRHGTPLALILIDLDGFKQLNDAQGHHAGDQLLVHLARLWRPGLRESDFLARWGGDEFALLLPQTDRTGAETVSDRIRAQSTASPTVIDGRAATAAFSAGIAVFAPPESTEDFVKRADQCLYQAKRAGGNQTR